VRIKSDAKRRAILDAAIGAFAAGGVWTTPTAAISRAACIAEGTLFTYFSSRALLVETLYRELKADIAAAMLAAYPTGSDERSRVRHIWNQNVRWGVAHPERLQVLQQMRSSDRLSAAARADGLAPFAELEQLARACIRKRLIRDLPVEYLAATMGSMAETTMAFVARHGDRPVDYAALGFETFWQGIAAPARPARPARQMRPRRLSSSLAAGR
jgi:AcrR family transcriptional regulator